MKSLILIAIGLCLAGISMAVKSVMDLPIVQISNATASCVKVWTPEGEGSCDALPDRYEVVWVQ